MGNIKTQTELLDREWIQLIIKAKGMGIEKEEIRKFLLKNEVKELKVKIAE
ncbi:DNA-binding anti-repressor SinI [Cytobacillus depressus]|uniref:DNA-binding anti-repressor SinI n=1 Tax=Cytobacillus depressus TaxID=1602942 RepID=A0A6L3V6K6_9BACI|nr:anti-repressor SinI family protein [Cytobacillus depressus]KAB2336092.1 DNA-binding anti-repressor SinI [Cytobacillus depressus]